MKFVSISDVHIKEPGDKAEKLFLQFLDSAETKESEVIFLLGDIFDLLVGQGYEVVERYKVIFSCIKDLLKSGKKIIQYEGNHDFHFQKLVSDLSHSWGLEKNQWEYKTKPMAISYGSDKILFCHGDEIEIGNYGYKFYRMWIRSWPIHFLSNYVVPGKWVQAIGDDASKKSRERNNNRYSEELMNEEVRPKFRMAARKASVKYGTSIVVCGHSHCKDEYREEGLQYFNNGYFPISKSFIYGDGEEIKLISLPTGQ